jgi:hypothetical protein
MSAISELRSWFQESFTPPLALQSFTALFGVKPNQHEALSNRISGFGSQENPPYSSIPGLHNLRWILFAPTEKSADPTPRAPRALILSLVFDGELDDVIEELMFTAGDHMRAVLGHCEGFHDESADPKAYLKRRKVPSGYMFRDIGPIAPDKHSARVADATLLELQSAMQKLNDFADFYSKHPPLGPERQIRSLMGKFLEKFDAPVARLPLHRLEVRQSEEERWVRLGSELMKRKQRRVERRMNDGVIRRGAHAKAHGLIHAKFKICKPESPHELAYRAGLFQAIGEEFDAILRLSNASDGVCRDEQRDVRGLAISLDVSGISGDWLGHPGRQDFVLIDHPTFITPNIQRFVELVAVAEMRDRRRQLWHGMRFLMSPGGLKQAAIIWQAFRSRPRHPLEPSFHSAVPYQMGRDHIVKYSVQPSSSQRIEPAHTLTSDDFLSGALESSLQKGIQLDFFVHALPATLDRKFLQTAVEDATIDWSTLGAVRVKVATIELGHQSENVAARMKQAEERTFSPWNALAEHRPLGSINRARRTAYRESAAARAAAQATPAVASRASPNLTPLQTDRGPDSEAAQ